MPVEVDEDFIRARVTFEMALRQAQGNHSSLKSLSFRNVELLRDKSWVPQMLEALAVNTTCTELDLGNSGLSDTALQQMAATLAVSSRCPKLTKLNLSSNPALSKMGETVARGLCKLRTNLELVLDDHLDPNAEGFVHDKQLVPGMSSWFGEDLKPEGGGMYDYFCPEEVCKAVGEKALADAKLEAGTPKGERLRLTRGAQGANGTKYKTEFATFEWYNQTGNIVLLTLKTDDEPGVIV